LTVDQKRALIEPEFSQISVKRQCELIELNRSSWYQLKTIQSHSERIDQNLTLKRQIDELYTARPFFGSRQMRDTLRRKGMRINRKRVQRLMRLMGLVSVAPKPGTSKRGIGHKIYPYLLRKLAVARPNQVWCTDITYIRLAQGFVYLVAVMDWHSRKVLSWELSATMDESFCLSALERAFRLFGKPEIFNTDQGAQFTSKAFTGLLKDQGVKISMDGKGRWADNVFVERLWRSLKYEEIYLKEYSSAQELRAGLKDYFEFYNFERPHQSHQGRTPAEVHFGLNPSQGMAA